MDDAHHGEEREANELQSLNEDGKNEEKDRNYIYILYILYIYIISILISIFFKVLQTSLSKGAVG